MTRSTNMEHVEVLRHMKETIRAIMPSEVAALDAAIASLSAQQPAAPVLAKHQPCGCVICTCEDEQQCQGCGAKHCGNRADHPPYVGQQPAAVDSEMVTRAVNAYDEATGEGWQMPCLQGMRAALTAALAAQPGGSDNDR